MAEKQVARERDERLKPLSHYRAEELKHMSQSFWGEGRRYHLTRAAFVRKQPAEGGRVVVPDEVCDRPAESLAS